MRGAEQPEPGDGGAATDGTAPPAPPGDPKDWTWVLRSACPECGFDAPALPAGQIAGLVRATARRWQQALAGPGVGTRPAPQVWSVLEYGSHCRDVYAVFGDRLDMMLEQDDPLFDNWDQDATAIKKRYWEADPTVVSGELAGAAARAAAGFDAVTGARWSRTGRRSNGSVFTVASLGRYFVHDLVHHLHDVGRPLPV